MGFLYFFLFCLAFSKVQTNNEEESKTEAIEFDPPAVENTKRRPNRGAGNPHSSLHRVRTINLAVRSDLYDKQLMIYMRKATEVGQKIIFKIRPEQRPTVEKAIKDFLAKYDKEL